MKVRILSTLFASLLFISAGAAPTFASEDQESSTTPEVSEHVEAEDPGQSSDEGVAPAMPWVCLFVQQLDHPHISHSEGPRAVHVHGNWANIDCSSNVAEVEVNLQRQNSLGIYTQVGATGYSAVWNVSWPSSKTTITSNASWSPSIISTGST